MAKQISLFVEDEGQEKFLTAIIERLLRDIGRDARVHNLSARGGASRMLKEVRALLTDIRAGALPAPDLLVIGRDANCRGRAKRQKELHEATDGAPCPVVMAIPDPHIERWYLLDGQAFKHALGTGCQAPDQKCDKHRYKMLLGQAVAAAGTAPLFGGIEHADAIVEALRLEQGQDPSFKHFLQDLRRALTNLP